VLAPGLLFHVRVLVEHAAVVRRALDPLGLVHAEQVDLAAVPERDDQLTSDHFASPAAAHRVARHHALQVRPEDALRLVPRRRAGEVARAVILRAADRALHEAALRDLRLPRSATGRRDVEAVRALVVRRLHRVRTHRGDQRRWSSAARAGRRPRSSCALHQRGTGAGPVGARPSVAASIASNCWRIRATRSSSDSASAPARPGC
jgi:hypothetical protein